MRQVDTGATAVVVTCHTSALLSRAVVEGMAAAAETGVANRVYPPCTKSILVSKVRWPPLS